MSGLVGVVGSKSGIVGQTDMVGGTITSEVIRSPDSLFYIPMQGLVVDATVFYDKEVMMDVSTGYGGLRSHLQYRYFRVQYDIKGSSAANHQGFFWGNTSKTTVQGGDSTGHRITHQQAGSNGHMVRDCNGNNQQGSAWDDYAPNDNTWHHHMILANTNGTTYVWTDGILRWQGAYQGLGYIGLVGYAGEVWYKNIKIRGWELSA